MSSCNGTGDRRSAVEDLPIYASIPLNRGLESESESPGGRGKGVGPESESFFWRRL